MKNILIGLCVLFGFFILVGLYWKNKIDKTTIVEQNQIMNSIHNYKAKKLLGEEVELSQYKGNVLLIVNTASKCGLTPQFEDLQNLHEQYENKGLKVLGFPSDNFDNQEYEKAEDIANFCTKNYGVTFEMFEQVNVRGEDKHPIYQFLTEKQNNGVLDSSISWNFQKYLLDKDGKLVEVINPRVRVTNPEVITKIEDLL